MFLFSLLTLFYSPFSFFLCSIAVSFFLSCCLALFREDAIYRRKQEKDVAELQRYEYELRDSAEFLRWECGKKDRKLEGKGG